MREQHRGGMYYRLDGTEVVPCSREETASYFEPGSLEARMVARAEVVAPLGTVLVSTVFMVINFAAGQDVPPRVFETMVFAPAYPALDGLHDHASSWEEALVAHQQALYAVMAALGLDQPPTAERRAHGCSTTPNPGTTPP